MKAIKFGALMTAGLLLSTAVQARDLTVVSWGGVSQENQRNLFYKPYTEKTGVAIAEDAWSGGLGLLAAKVSGGNPDWDIVQVERHELLLGCPDGVFEKIDWDVLGGKDSFIAPAQSDCGVGMIVWGIGLAYDSTKLSEGPTSWADFFDLEKFPGKRGLRQGPQQTLEFALMADGVGRDEVYDVLATPEGIDRAFAKLDTIKDQVIWWTAATAPGSMLASGEVTMSAMYSSRVANSNRYEGQSYTLVKDGAMYNVDYWVVLKGSEHKEEAFRLINFMTGAEQQAAYADANADAPTRLAGIEETSPEALKYLMTSPEQFPVALMTDDEFWADNGEELTMRFNAWAGQ